LPKEKKGALVPFFHLLHCSMFASEIKIISISHSPQYPKSKTMSAIALSYINRINFFGMKEEVTDIVNGMNNIAQPALKSDASDADYMKSISGCKCCGWKGKFSQTQKKYLFFKTISEIESFCPKCDTYLGFISEVK
jgi:hypothetical protein